MTRKMPHPVSFILLLMFSGCVLVVTGIRLASYNLSLIPIGEASVDWIKTDGRITKFQIVKRLVGEYEPTELFCGPIVQYTYNVGGYVFTTDLVSFNYDANENCSGTEADLYDPRYTVGKQVIVYYDPEQPSLAVLEPGPCVACYPGAIFGGIVVLIGIFVLGKAIRNLFERR